MTETLSEQELYQLSIKGITVNKPKYKTVWLSSGNVNYPYKEGLTIPSNFFDINKNLYKVLKTDKEEHYEI